MQCLTIHTAKLNKLRKLYLIFSYHEAWKWAKRMWYGRSLSEREIVEWCEANTESNGIIIVFYSRRCHRHQPPHSIFSIPIDFLILLPPRSYYITTMLVDRFSSVLNITTLNSNLNIRSNNFTFYHRSCNCISNIRYHRHHRALKQFEQDRSISVLR